MNARPRGFTLVELVVAIGIVVLMAGLTLSVATKVVETSEIRQTEAAMALLDQAVKTWEITADRKLTWWDVYDPNAFHGRADVHGDTPPVLIITEMLAAIGRNGEVRGILAQIDPQLVVRYESGSYPIWIKTPTEQGFVDDTFDGAITVVDAWGTPIYATHPGRTRDPLLYPQEPVYYPAADPDGTIRTYNERDYGIAPNRQIVFVAAGPDRRFGTDNEFPHLQGAALQQAMQQARRDNLFTIGVSFP